MIFESNGQLNDWAAAQGVEVVDAGQPLLSYDPVEGRYDYSAPPVRTVVDFIARHLSSLPLKVYRRGEDESRERVRVGPLAELIARPTPEPRPAMRFWYSLITDGLLTDRFLAVTEVRDGKLWLRRIPSRRWQVRSDFFDQVVGVRVFGADGVGVDVDASELVMDVGYATSSARGTSQLRTLRAVLAEYQESIEYRAAVNRNGPRSTFAVLRDKPWPDKDSRERFARGMRAFTSGGGSAGSSLLLEDGMKPERLDSFKPIDVGDLDARDKVKIDVANAYGIPAEMMGLREGNFSNLAAFFKALYGVHLRPYIVAFEQALNVGLVDLVQPGEGLYVEFDTDAQMRGTPETQYPALVRATGRPFLTTNEARDALNRPRIDGGDELITPLNVAVGGQVEPGDQEIYGQDPGDGPDE